jgi:hypothetical protein
MTAAFKSMDDRDAAYALLSSRIAWLWWQAIGDDYNVTSWFLSELPGINLQLRAGPTLAEVGRKTREYVEANQQLIEYRPRLGHLIGNLDTRSLSFLLDRAILELFAELGVANRWDVLEASYWRAMKVSYSPTLE